MRFQPTTGAAAAAFASAPSKGIHLGMQADVAPSIESDVQKQITRLAQQAEALSYVVGELSARLGPLLFPEMVAHDQASSNLPAQAPAGTALAQAISECTDRFVTATRQLNDVQNRLGI